jgi:diguanylate cyclase (GGDEF)-like protein/PAS domain S-box-containing protein
MTDPINPPADHSPAISQQQTLLEYQAILENASVGISFTRDRRVLHCNPKFSEIFGWPHGELVGQPGSIFYLSDEDYVEIGQLASPILTSGGLFDREIFLRRKDGSAVYCQMRVKAINPKNTAEGTIWITEEIGERKRARIELDELVLRQRAILENASVGIMFTRDGLVVHCNPSAEGILGWSPGTLAGNKAQVFFQNSEDYARFGEMVGHKLAAGELIDVEWLNARKDGSLVWCRNLAKALQTADGSRSTIWITEDISESKATQEALITAHRELEYRVLERTTDLAKAHQQLKTMFESSPIATYARDINHVVTSWNPAAEQLFGWNAREIVGHPVPTIPEGKWGETEDLRRRVVNGETIVQLEMVRQRRDGTVVDVSVTLAPLKDSSDHLYGYLTIAADITQRKAAEQKIRQLAYHDPLTGLPNRLLMRDRFQQAVAHADRAKTKVALLFLDLDNFKNINDSLGHTAGDAMLTEVAARLAQCVRETDTISRQGGDEFLIVLSDLSDVESIPPILTKLMDRLQEPFHADGQELSTTVSIGITLFPEDGCDFESLLKKADIAMYRAKDAGRNTYRFFDESMNTEAVERLAMQNGLRRALERQEFVLHYQPKIELASGRVIGAEALIRWNHPDRGMVPPGRFIHVAEESGLIVAIGDWVIHEACRQAMAWKRAGLPELSMAVNLSAVQFKRGDVGSAVMHALEETELEPALLELELTESILIQNVESVLATVQGFKRLGIKLSIDDFGTGYSSLSYLKRFDIDKLKIDQSFICDLASDPNDAAIVRAIIQMARSLNLKTVAEGVETIAALEKLQTFGCDEAQGYLFARPMPADEFERYLSQLPDGRGLTGRLDSRN